MNSGKEAEAVINNLIKNGFVVLDGATGTALHKMGIDTGKYTEVLNITNPEAIIQLHRSYIEAGSQIVYANTFGASRYKLVGSGYTPEELIIAGVRNAKKAAEGTSVCVALSIGPLGQLLEPLGTLTFEEAYEAFKEMVLAGVNAGVDLIVIETMSDLYEIKAALLAAKENSELPVFASMSFEKNGRTFTGCTVESAARTLEALGADAVGMNCSVGPDNLAPLIAIMAKNVKIPVIAKPNAGLPDPVTGNFDMDPEEFKACMEKCIEAGATIVGGCCGTDTRYIEKVKELTIEKPIPERTYEKASFVCTPTIPVKIDNVKVVGERINPTGKKRFQQALLENDLDYILQVGIQQMDAGAQILDVNVGYPGVDEAEMLPKVVKKLQSAIPLPLQLDSTNPAALEAGLRVYNGKPAVNSVNEEKEIQEKILPIVKKYGASVVGLTLSNKGLAKDADERFEIASQILYAAKSYGIAEEDVWIDCLTLTVSAQQEQAKETLRAIYRVKNELGLRTTLGVSNISFGMPERGLITRTFLAQAMALGLDLPIINPNQKEIMDVVGAHRVLTGEDAESKAYIARHTAEDAFETNHSAVPDNKNNEPASMTLEDAIMRGLKSEAAKIAEEMTKDTDEMALVQEHLIPALDKVGTLYEQGKVFLPQLLSSAQAAQNVFEVIRVSVLNKGSAPIKKEKLVIATVKGDIHDIGKNIVKTLLENYGYQVIDLGKDVQPEEVCKAVREGDVKMVGLSALMTTTLPAMEETIRQLREIPNSPAVMVGGAVVTPEYAKSIGADYYAKDARMAVEVVRKELG